MTLSLISTGLLDPQSLITGAGAWGLAIVCAAVFAETGLLVGFFLPGDTLLFFTGVLTLSGAIREPLWLVILLVGLAAALGDQLGYTIGRKTGPAVFERRESGVFSRKSVTRTQNFFDRFGPVAVTIARFVPVVRTFAPVAAGVGRMPRRLFTFFNLIGAALWSGSVIVLGFALAHLPGVADFVSQYIDIVLIGIVVVSVVPILVRTITVRRRAAATQDVD
ncbi:DedA family protein [Glaciihabitans sp. UYNi722]|uniref:DedA family protein n=1 Tax=Glaciihabitans sp. UYNi722 TaxID=3156344 RepID=UPI0033910E7F